MLTSKKQFTFFYGWGRPSAVIPSEYFPLRLGFALGNDWNGDEKTRIFVSNEKDDHTTAYNEYYGKQALGLRQVCKQNIMPSGFNTLMATADGMMERAVLCMLSQEDSLGIFLSDNTSIYAPPAMFDLVECPINLNWLESADVRAEMAYVGGRFSPFRMSGMSAWYALRMLIQSMLYTIEPRYDGDKMRWIFPPQITIGKWGDGDEGRHWERLENNDAETILPVIVPSESDSEDFCPFSGLITDIIRDSEFVNQCDTGYEGKTWYGYDCTSTLSRWIESYFSECGLADVLFRHTAIPEEGMSLSVAPRLYDLFRSAILTVIGENAFGVEVRRSGIMPHMMKLFDPGEIPLSRRFSGFDWLAINVFLERVCRYGVQGWTDSYYNNDEAKFKRRVTFPNRHVSRTVTVSVVEGEISEESKSGLTVRLDNAKVDWSEPTLDDYGEFSYYESDLDGDRIGIYGERSYDLSRICEIINFFGYDEFLARVAPDVISTNSVPVYIPTPYGYQWEKRFENPNPAVTCFHCSTRKIIDLYNEYIARTGYDTLVKSELEVTTGSISKQFTASYCDTVGDGYTSKLTADASGLDTFPCKFAKDNGYVPSHQMMYSIAHCRMWDGSDDSISPNENLIFIDKAIWGAEVLNRESDKKGMEWLAKAHVNRCYKAINIAARKRQIGNEMKSEDEVLDWINGFDFGDGTEAFLQKKLDDAVDSMTWGIYTNRDWIDFYIVMTSSGERVIASSLYQTCIGSEPDYGKSDSYYHTYWDFNSKYDTSKKIALESDTAEFDCYPNRTEMKRDYILRITTPRWLSAFNWQWKGACNYWYP